MARISHHRMRTNHSVPLLRRSSAGRNPLPGTACAKQGHTVNRSSSMAEAIISARETGQSPVFFRQSVWMIPS